MKLTVLITITIAIAIAMMIVIAVKIIVVVVVVLLLLLVMLHKSIALVIKINHPISVMAGVVGITIEIVATAL